LTAPEEENETADERVLLEAYRLAEQNLQSQLDIALAADQRAATFCGLVVAALAALVGLSDGGYENWFISASIMFFALSAVLSARAFMPVDFFVRGLPFDNFAEDINNKRNFSEVIGELAGHYDDCLAKNADRIKSNANLFRTALFCSLGGIVLLTIPTVLEPIMTALTEKNA